MASYDGRSGGASNGKIRRCRHCGARNWIDTVPGKSSWDCWDCHKPNSQ